MHAYIALGANLDDPIAQVCAGAQALGHLPRTRRLGCSSLYRSTPVGDANQPDFINAVCALDTALAARELLQALLAIEHDHGRVRERIGGPRTLDLDLLLYGQSRIDEPGLTVPHPRLHARAFVLYPLHEIAPDLVILGRGPVAGLLSGCAGQKIERLARQAG